jgi:hypothetical protein
MGLREGPTRGVVLRHVKFDPKRGLTIGYAEISGQDVKVQVQEGKPVRSRRGRRFLCAEGLWFGCLQVAYRR